jgi:hypothetical protein
MTAAHAIIVIGGSFLLMSAMITWMRSANRREQTQMQRRYDEWVANGSHPDEKPNFFTGSGGSGGGA